MDFALEYLVPAAGSLLFVVFGVSYFVQKYRPKNGRNIVAKMLYFPVLIDPNNFASELDYNRAKRRIVSAVGIALGCALCLGWYVEINQLSTIFSTTTRQAILFFLGPVLLVRLIAFYFSIEISDDSDQSI